MMIKKQLGVLAGSVLLASGAHAAVLNSSDLVQGDMCVSDPSACLPGQASSTSDVVFLLNNLTTKQTLVYNAGITGDQLAAGASFSIDLSLNANFAGFIADSWSLFGITSGTVTYNTTSSFIELDGVGLVFASTVPSPAISFNALSSSVQEANDTLDAYNGLEIVNDPNSFPQLGASAVASGLLNAPSTLATVFVIQGAGGDIGPTAQQYQFTFDGSSMVAGGVVSEVPVPAAAWLFGSAMVGLGILRRRRV